MIGAVFTRAQFEEAVANARQEGFEAGVAQGQRSGHEPAHRRDEEDRSSVVRAGYQSHRADRDISSGYDRPVRLPSVFE